MQALHQPSILINIQFLRFFAASLVMSYHTLPIVGTMLGMDTSIFQPIEYIGFAGVDIFFVISGFVIYYSTTDGAASQDKTYPLRFIAIRAARIFIGYLPFFVAAVVMLHLLNPDLLNKADLLTSFFLIPDQYDEVLIRVSWTLSYELYFYLVFFAILFSKKRIHLIIALFLIILIFDLIVGKYLRLFSYRGYNNLGIYERFLTYPWILEFFAGCLVAHAIQHGAKRYAATAITVSLVILVVAAYLNSTVFHGKLEQLPKHPTRILMIGTASALLIYGLVNLELKGWQFPVLFSQYAGGASYCIYLSHLLFIDTIQYSFLKDAMIASAIPPILWIGIVMASIVIFSFMFYHFFERPCYQFAKRCITSRKVPAYD